MTWLPKLREDVDTIDIDALQRALWDKNIPDAAAAEMASFGQFLLGMLEGRIHQRQGRAITVMGWLVASLAFLLLSAQSGATGPLGSGAIIFGTFTAIVGIVLCLYAGSRELHTWFGLRAWLWAKGDADFSRAIKQPDMLNRLRVFEIARTFSWRMASNADKSVALVGAELALALCGAVLAIELLRGVVG